MVYPGSWRPGGVDRAARRGTSCLVAERGPHASRTRQRRTARRTPVYRQLWFLVVIAIILGILFGLLFEEQALEAQWLAEAFIQLIKAVTGPVIFVTVVIGIASLGDMARAGGLALRALGYFLAMTVIALTLGLVAGNLIEPGGGFEGEVSAAAREDAKASIGEAGGDQGFVGFITGDLLPTSFVSPFVENEILRVLVLALLTAAAVSGLPKVQREKVVGVFEVAAQVIFRIIRIIMWAAPIGAFGGMAFTVAKFGGHLAEQPRAADGHVLGHLRGLRLRRARPGRPHLGLLDPPPDPPHPRRAADHPRHLVVGDRAAAPAREAPGGRRVAPGHGRGSARPATRSTSTAPASTSPWARCSSSRPPARRSRSAPRSACSALMVLTSKGAAGITGAGLVTLTASLQAFGGEFFNAESIAVGIALVVGIDRIMSEGRALTNAIGNSVAVMVVAKWQGERDEERFQEALRSPGKVERATDRRARAGAAAA